MSFSPRFGRATGMHRDTAMLETDASDDKTKTTASLSQETLKTDRPSGLPHFGNDGITSPSRPRVSSTGSGSSSVAGILARASVDIVTDTFSCPETQPHPVDFTLDDPDVDSIEVTEFADDVDSPDEKDGAERSAAEIEDIPMVEAMRRESVIERDERQRITPCTSPPYHWICRLEIETQRGGRYVGTGWFCNILSGKSAILTCAHNLYVHDQGGWAEQIRVYPGRDGSTTPFGYFTVTKSYLRVPYNWENASRGRPSDDYGVIFLPPRIQSKMPGGYGFPFRVMSDSALRDRIITVCGYPGTSRKIPRSTMWIAGGKIKSSDYKTFHYENDTEGGQSGSPVWTWDTWNWMAIGIHGYGSDNRNSARRITVDMVKTVRAWGDETIL
ncbi:unnamed protein product [Owenia fusiformis]|uniref:Serine protease n=1 Tax=Owenia fusiformis TaxID=6347 RepID=A0A8J1TYG9_OWEFU|nr:unnamed protein product [Owenia fusiformis]